MGFVPLHVAGGSASDQGGVDAELVFDRAFAFRGREEGADRIGKQYRTYLSVVVLTTILVSLVGGNYYGPGSKRVAQNGGRWKPSVEGEM